MFTYDAAQLALDLMEKHGLLKWPGWIFQFDRAKRRCGCCDYKNRVISLSEHYVRRNGPDQVQNTILHEIAHALAGPEAGHSWAWRKVALAIGCDGLRCNNKANMPAKKFEAVCVNCGPICRRHRRRHRVICSTCRGQIAWRLAA